MKRPFRRPGSRGWMVAVAVVWGAAAGSAKDALPARAVPAFAFPAVTAAVQGTLSAAGLKGRPWIAQFLFTQCAGPCPMLTQRMATLQNMLPKALWLVSFTVDPDRDTLAKLQYYARQWKADPQRWWFVRAEKKPLLDLVQTGFLLSVLEDPQAASGFRVTHSTQLVLVDGTGVIRGYYDGQDTAALKRLAADAKALLRKPPGEER